MVTHAGNTDARSFAEPGGSRFANTIISSHETTTTAMPITARRISTRQPYEPSPLGVGQGCQMPWSVLRLPGYPETLHSVSEQILRIEKLERSTFLA